MFALAWVGAGQSLFDFPAWVTTSLRVSSGYDAAMSTENDRARRGPSLLMPGDRVRFVPIDEARFRQAMGYFASGVTGALLSMLFSGAGIRGGTVFGASDAQAAYPAANPVSTADICSTIYHALGIDHETLVHDQVGRPFRKGEGCRVCHDTGFKGRLGVYEVMEVSPSLKRLFVATRPYERLAGV